jgi:tetratricopeptide (TPR) repeat protein
VKLGVRFSCLAILAAVCGWAQTSTTTTGTSTNGTASTTNPSGSTTNTTTPTPTINPAPGGGAGSIFLSGKVMMDDGSPLAGSVSIESICGPLRRTMDHTTANGAFAFQWTTTAHSFGDASEAVRAVGGNGGGALTGSRNGSRGMDPLANCELLADSAGYSSSRVSLYDRAGQSTYDVGVIVMHRISGGEGRTVSLLALKAPKEARRSFEKGTSLATANKPEDALTNFEMAVRLYPQYADAWLGRGKIQWQLERKEDARESFRKAMELDGSLVGPWEELGYLACDDAKWEEAVRYLDQAVRLDPMDSPAAWYFNALANYNLGRFDRAERSVRAALKLDNGKNPQADYVLALVLIARQDLAGGAAALRSYIASSPKTADAETAKRVLSRLETQLGTSHYAEAR